MKNLDIQAIAEGKIEVDIKAMSPMEALQVGLAVRDYQEQNDLIEKVGYDYDAIGKFISDRNK